MLIIESSNYFVPVHDNVIWPVVLNRPKEIGFYNQQTDLFLPGHKDNNALFERYKNGGIKPFLRKGNVFISCGIFPDFQKIASTLMNFDLNVEPMSKNDYVIGIDPC